MEMNSTEWARTQTLFLELVEILTPLATGSSSSSRATSILFAKHLFIPPSGEMSSFPYPVTVLNALQSTRKEIETLFPQNSAENREDVSSDKKIPTEKKLAEKRENFDSTSPKNRPAVPGQMEKGEGSLKQPKQSQLPLTAAAQKIILQVREAIQILSSPADPRSEPLRQALQRLKPLVDQLIEDLSRGEMPSSDDGFPPANRFSLPKSLSSSKKEIPFPHANFKEGELQKERTKKDVKINKEDSPSQETTKTKKEQTPPVSHKDKAIQPSSDNSSSHPKNPALNCSGTFPSNTSLQQTLKQKGDPESKPLDRISLPGAPYTAGLFSSAFHRKKKKKRPEERDQEEEKEDR